MWDTGRSLQALMRMLAFDVLHYRHVHEDLAALDPDAALDHFCRYGLHEDRLARFGLLYAEFQSRRAWLDLSAELAGHLEFRLLQERVHRLLNFGIDDALILDLLAAPSRYRPVLVIGDSHSRFLTEIRPSLAEGVLPVPLLCSGGSARGLANPQSRSGYNATVTGLLEEAGAALAGKVAVFQFGQVDIEFVYDLRRIERRMTGFDEADFLAFLAATADAYIGFVEACRGSTPARLVVAGIYPPALSDATLREGYVNAHIGFLESDFEMEALRRDLTGLDFPDLARRTAYHRRFNDLLRERCAARGLPFLDDFDAFLGADGVIHPDYLLGFDGRDHHLSFHAPAADARMRANAAALRDLAPAVHG